VQACLQQRYSCCCAVLCCAVNLSHTWSLTAATITVAMLLTCSRNCCQSHMMRLSCCGGCCSTLNPQPSHCYVSLLTTAGTSDVGTRSLYQVGLLYSSINTQS